MKADPEAPRGTPLAESRKASFEGKTPDLSGSSKVMVTLWPVEEVVALEKMGPRESLVSDTGTAWSSP